MGYKFNKYTLKFCKFYDEDVYGRFAIRPKKTHKSLNIIYLDSLKQGKKLNKLYKLYIKIFFNLKTELKILRRLLFLTQKNNNVGRLRFYLFNMLKAVITNIINFLRENQKFFNLNEGKFNYRVDIGKPSRKKRRITRHSLRLLTRHKLSSFAGKIPIYQFKKYLKINRNLKYFSMNFLFMIESRIDVILYRLNFSNSPGFIRQYIIHQGVLINNKLITTPSFQVTLNDTLSFVNKKEAFNRIFYNFHKKLIFMSLPIYYEVNFRLMAIKFYMIPRLEMIFYPFKIDKLRLSSFGKHF